MTIPEFHVVGIELKTSESVELKSDRPQIPTLWKTFSERNILKSIPNRVDRKVIEVYHSYQPGGHGGYTFLLGAKVSSLAKIPDGMVGRTIPAGRFALVKTDVGGISDIERSFWQKLLQIPDLELGARRNFSTDFVLYDEVNADIKKVQVPIYIGVSN